eukprot:CAMPEP_0202915002 /NCGR_PEP_ID=MMETSP1392-20130828/64626_1 /ASSEMBLY_ACC=CAM_ASM_000868 /TAXON_ID=225041 /ORGANISM="Chlamydomonas chlamydogama, Strain SAG 11-48b" /LENGTH=167 /DNA_ID=CAMNT_0049606879 /DNA_START=667 /DNA_END=1172 /DNA_ORIENTATION=-
MAMRAGQGAVRDRLVLGMNPGDTASAVMGTGSCACCSTDDSLSVNHIPHNLVRDRSAGVTAAAAGSSAAVGLQGPAAALPLLVCMRPAGTAGAGRRGRGAGPQTSTVQEAADSEDAAASGALGACQCRQQMVDQEHMAQVVSLVGQLPTISSELGLGGWGYHARVQH